MTVLDALAGKIGAATLTSLGRPPIWTRCGRDWWASLSLHRDGKIDARLPAARPCAMPAHRRSCRSGELARSSRWNRPAHKKLGQHLSTAATSSPIHGIGLAGIVEDTTLQSLCAGSDKSHDTLAASAIAASPRSPTTPHRQGA